MFMKRQLDEVPLATSLALRVALGVTLAMTLLIGIYPQPIIVIAREAVRPFFLVRGRLCPRLRGKRMSLWAQVGYYSSLGFILPGGAVAGFGWAGFWTDGCTPHRFSHWSWAWWVRGQE